MKILKISLIVLSFFISADFNGFEKSKNLETKFSDANIKVELFSEAKAASKCRLYGMVFVDCGGREHIEYCKARPGSSPCDGDEPKAPNKKPDENN
jgi:thioredoxin-related protein